jgi:hypothetical protein
MATSNNSIRLIEWISIRLTASVLKIKDAQTQPQIFDYHSIILKISWCWAVVKLFVFRTTRFPPQIHVLKSHLAVKYNLKNTQIQVTYHLIINVATRWDRKWSEKKWGTTHSCIVLGGVQFIPKLSWAEHNIKYLSGRQVRFQCNIYKSDKQNDNFGGESNSNDGYKNRPFNRK